MYYGGPGALFWMWVTAFFGSALKYAECTLAVEFRDFDKHGMTAGGPMYTIEKGLTNNRFTINHERYGKLKIGNRHIINNIS